MLNLDWKNPFRRKAVPTEETPQQQQQQTPTKQSPGSYLRDVGFIALTEEFNNENVGPLVASILEYNIMPEELRPEKITFLINSPGGRVDSCKMLLDTMAGSEIPIHTYGSGMIASCAIITLMAGHMRSASETCQLMSHQYSAGSMGKEHELYGRVKSFEHTSEWMVRHYKHCTGLDEDTIRKELLSPTDHWLTAEEAKSYNIIDEVLTIYEDGE